MVTIEDVAASVGILAKPIHDIIVILTQACGELYGKIMFGKIMALASPARSIRRSPGGAAAPSCGRPWRLDRPPCPKKRSLVRSWPLAAIPQPTDPEEALAAFPGGGGFSSGAAFGFVIPSPVAGSAWVVP
jgi:hypothetical protein